MFAVLVTFVIKENETNLFKETVLNNAMRSLELEPGCRQFDVCVSNDDANTIILYEVYDSREDFQLHLKSRHFIEFNDIVTPWVLNKTIVELKRL